MKLVCQEIGCNLSLLIKMQSSALLFATIHFRSQVQEPRSNVKVTEVKERERKKRETREGDSLPFSDPRANIPG